MTLKPRSRLADPGLRAIQAWESLRKRRGDCSGRGAGATLGLFFEACEDRILDGPASGGKGSKGVRSEDGHLHGPASGVTHLGPLDRAYDLNPEP